MADRDRFSHTGINGTAPHQRTAYHGFKGSDVGENIYKYTSGSKGFRRDWNTGKQSVDSWMNSPGHRRNILDPLYNCIGIGMARKG